MLLIKCIPAHSTASPASGKADVQIVLIIVAQLIPLIKDGSKIEVNSGALISIPISRQLLESFTYSRLAHIHCLGCFFLNMLSHLFGRFAVLLLFLLWVVLNFIKFTSIRQKILLQISLSFVIFSLVKIRLVRKYLKGPGIQNIINGLWTVLG